MYFELAQKVGVELGFFRKKGSTTLVGGAKQRLGIGTQIANVFSKAGRKGLTAEQVETESLKAIQAMFHDVATSLNNRAVNVQAQNLTLPMRRDSNVSWLVSTANQQAMAANIQRGLNPDKDTKQSSVIHRIEADMNTLRRKLNAASRSEKQLAVDLKDLVNAGSQLVYKKDGKEIRLSLHQTVYDLSKDNPFRAGGALTSSRRVLGAVNNLYYSARNSGSIYWNIFADVISSMHPSDVAAAWRAAAAAEGGNADPFEIVFEYHLGVSDAQAIAAINALLKAANNPAVNARYNQILQDKGLNPAAQGMI